VKPFRSLVVVGASTATIDAVVADLPSCVAVNTAFAPGTAAALDIESRSGGVRVEGLQVTGTVDKRRVAGTLGAGGPTVQARSGSGSIRLKGPS